MRRDEFWRGRSQGAVVPVGEVGSWSDGEKAALVRYVRKQRAAGRLTIVSELAKELGISPSVISGWMRWHGDRVGTPGCRQRPETIAVSTSDDIGFVEVAVVPAEPCVSASRPTVVSPSGFRVEGLDLAGVVAVLKALS